MANKPGDAPLIQSACLPITAAQVTPEPLVATARCEDFALNDPRHAPPPHYPGVRPAASYVVADGTVFPLRPGDQPSSWEVMDHGRWQELDIWLEARDSPKLSQRVAVLAYGSNANPKSVATITMGNAVVVLTGLLFGAQASYCASTRRDGQHPAGLVRSAADIAERHALLLVDPTQMKALDRKEGAGLGIYRLSAIETGDSLEFVLEDGTQWEGPLPTYIQGAQRNVARSANGTVPLRDLPQVAFQELLAGGAPMEESAEHDLPLLSRINPTPGLRQKSIPALVPQDLQSLEETSSGAIADASARYDAPGVDIWGRLVTRDLDDYQAFLARLDQEAWRAGGYERYLVRLADGGLAWTWMPRQGP